MAPLAVSFHSGAWCTDRVESDVGFKSRFRLLKVPDQPTGYLLE